MPIEDDDLVATFMSRYIDSVERGTQPPSLDDLAPVDRSEVEELLSQIHVDFNVDVEVPPIEESRFAVERGIVRRPPAVAIHGDAVRRARTSAGLSETDVAEKLTRFGYTTDAARIGAIEGAESTLMSPREARRLAAVVSVPLEVIEASGEAWPANEKDALDDIGGDHELLVMGRHLVYRFGDSMYAGVVRCRGLAGDLDSLTFRRVAGRLLQGEWNHLHAAVLVTAVSPRKVLVVDPFDCVPRLVAPSGDFGFGALEPAGDLEAALDQYNARFKMHWSDPPAYFSEESALGWTGLLNEQHIRTAIQNIQQNVNRFAEVKRAGYLFAIDCLGEQTADEFERLVAAIEGRSVEETEMRIAEVLAK